jgi:hypothetical protein
MCVRNLNVRTAQYKFCFFMLTLIKVWQVALVVYAGQWLADPKHLHVPGANELPVSAPCMLAVLKHSFSHVLGIDGDLLNITAAKELKAAGRLCFKPVADSAQQQAQQGHGQGTGSGEEQQEEGDEMCVVQVPEEVDRDRVRWVGLVPCTLRCHIE